jgi:hypothetical protein
MLSWAIPKDVFKVVSDEVFARSAVNIVFVRRVVLDVYIVIPTAAPDSVSRLLVHRTVGDVIVSRATHHRCCRDH